MITFYTTYLHADIDHGDLILSLVILLTLSILSLCFPQQNVHLAPSCLVKMVESHQRALKHPISRSGLEFLGDRECLADMGRRCWSRNLDPSSEQGFLTSQQVLREALLRY